MVFICYFNVTLSMLWTAGKYKITDLIHRAAGKGKKQRRNSGQQVKVTEEVEYTVAYQIQPFHQSIKDLTAQAHSPLSLTLQRM